jgi:hypothetical protein
MLAFQILIDGFAISALYALGATGLLKTGLEDEVAGVDNELAHS